MRNFSTLSLIAVCAVVFSAAPAMADSSDGAKLYKKKCASCHKMEKHGVGPMLKGIIGRKAGDTDYPRYKALVGAEFTWDENNLSEWIANPKKFIGKRTTMAGKIKKAEDRAAIIEYLKSESD